MVIHFTKTLAEALQNIDFSILRELPIYEAEEARTHLVSDSVIGQYGQAKWAIVDILNERYGVLLSKKFDLYNWLKKNLEDEVAYFINEAGSNCLNYSEYLAPWRFQLWLGKKGFIIGVEQKGAGFDALIINEEKIKKNYGGAFTFFRECKGTVFFDDPREAKVVYFLVLVSDKNKA